MKLLFLSIILSFTIIFISLLSHQRHSGLWLSVMYFHWQCLENGKQDEASCKVQNDFRMSTFVKQQKEKQTNLHKGKLSLRNRIPTFCIEATVDAIVIKNNKYDWKLISATKSGKDVENRILELYEFCISTKRQSQIEKTKCQEWHIKNW